MIVVKVGGSEGINYDYVVRDLVRYKEVVLVHGGSHELDELSAKLGNPPQIITSPSGIISRRTDRKTLEIFTMVYCGKMNKMIVEKLQGLGINAVGLSGMDGRLLVGKRKDVIIWEKGKRKILHNDYTGTIEKVNVGLLQLLLQNGFLPVISPPALSRENETINVDGDRAAAMIASTLKADVLVILSNTPGLLRDPKDEKSLIKKVERESREEAMEVAQGRMKKKVMGACDALERGVTKVVLGDARIENPITRALAGEGTVFQ